MYSNPFLKEYSSLVIKIVIAGLFIQFGNHFHFKMCVLAPVLSCLADNVNKQYVIF